MMAKQIQRCALGLLALALTQGVMAADWPMWRGDAGHTRVTTESLPARLALRWTRTLPPAATAWHDEGEMRFDRLPQPIAMGTRLFVPSTVNDSLTAYDLATGAELWRFYADGPIRVAPAGWKDRVFVGADDGCLYCLNAADGAVRWTFRAGPSGRRMIGNERLISTWPLRGGPVVADDTVYCAAGVWPFMGVFVYALECETGRVVWDNDSVNFTYRYRPHPNAAGFSGLSPQGNCVVDGDRLLIPGSRSNPALFDRRTGSFLGYAEGTGPIAMAQGDYGFAGGRIFSLRDGLSVRVQNGPHGGVLAPAAWYTEEGVYDPASLTTDKQNVYESNRFTFDAADGSKPKINFVDVYAGTITRAGPSVGQPLLLAGNQLITTGRNSLQVVDVTDPLKPAAAMPIGVPANSAELLLANGYLVAVSPEGNLSCYGSAPAGAPITYDLPQTPQAAPTAWEAKARQILALAGKPDGYALVLGLQDGGLVEELLRQSDLTIIAIDSDAARVDALRRRLDAAGRYGARASAIVADPAALPIAPYVASLITSETATPLPAAALFTPLRPYGGAAVLRGDRQAALAAAALPGATVTQAEGYTVLARPGALPGAADWVGQNADAGNTRCSQDALVMAPLGVLWYGDALSNALVLPRHGEGPVQQVVGGRLFIEGSSSLSAADIYTGRPLWTRTFPDLGKYYDIAKHQLGAHALGSNYFAVEDAVYVAVGKRCHLLDPKTGNTLREFALPNDSEWLFMLVDGDLLIAGQDPQVRAEGTPGKFRFNTPAYSKALVVMDRHTGQVLWAREAKQGFSHYAVSAGNGTIFAIDGARIYALDARTGQERWQTDQCVGDKLSYSAAYDVLVSAGALRGKDGQVLWAHLLRPAPGAVAPDDEPPAEGAPPALTPTHAPSDTDLLWSGKWGLMINDKTILTQSSRMFDLLTGTEKTWQDEAGKLREWSFPRSHGCGPIAASRYLSTFRSGDAGFADLRLDSGTGNLGGFRSGCTNNLIVGGGVLTAPDYTRTCSCAYQNRSSLGLISMPDMEFWTYGGVPGHGRIGFNPGAPGDRRSEDGTLWWGNPLPADNRTPEKTQLIVEPAARTYYRHSSRMAAGSALPWVAASGLTGMQTVKIPIASLGTDAAMTVRLYFADTQYAEAGKRVFSIALDGRPVVTDLDIAGEAGGAYRTLVKELRGIRYGGAKAGDEPVLTLTFIPKVGEPILSGVEVVAE